MDAFSIHTKIFLGSKALDRLAELPIGQACVVCDPFMVESGAVGRVTGILDGMGAKWDIFDKVAPNPTLELVAQGVAHILSYKPDTVIALGGGSAIDTGKSISYIYAKTGGKKPRCVAIPTTSGTGSEVTSFAVLSDGAAGTKYPLTDDLMLPDFALLDPSLTLSVPARVTADTGMDVLTHAVEAYVSPAATDFTDALAEKAFALVLDDLPAAVKNGADAVARERLHSASCLAGIAFNNASLGLCHGMAHPLGELLHLPHGRCNALLLPHIVAFNAGLGEQGEFPARRRCTALARMAGCCCHSDAVAAAGLVRRIQSLMDRIGMERTLKDPELRSKLEGCLDELSAAALADRCTGGNPRAATPAQIKRLYQKLI